MSDPFTLPPAAWRALRARYQRGLLQWLNGADAALGLGEMQAALAAITASRGDAAFWRTVHTLLSALQDGTLPADEQARRLCGRFDRQLRLLEQGAAAVDRSLVSETFDFVTAAIFAAPAAPAAAEPQPTEPAPAMPAMPAIAAEPPPVLAIAPADQGEVAAEVEPLAEFASLLLPSDEIDLDPEAVGRWEGAGAVVATAWAGRHQAGLAAFRSAVINLCGVAVDLDLPEALHFAEALATVADRADEPEIFDDPRLQAAVAAALEVLAEPGTVKRKVFTSQVDNLSGRLAAALEEAGLPTEGRLIVSRTLYQMFVGEAHESLQHLHDELATLHPLVGEMAEAATALADNAATIDLAAVRDLALALASALARFEAPVNVEVPAERQLVTMALETLEQMVEVVAAGEQPEAAPILIAALASGGGASA
jgi:HPt (histidine-containing phosphotransfer) domain-containing protein